MSVSQDSLFPNEQAQRATGAHRVTAPRIDQDGLHCYEYKGQRLRTLIKQGEPWFVAKDVTNILGIANSSAAMGRVHDSLRGKVHITAQRDGNTINIAGLHQLIVSCHKPEAHTFGYWLSERLLPSFKQPTATTTAAKPVAHQEAAPAQASPVEESHEQENNTMTQSADTTIVQSSPVEDMSSFTFNGQQVRVITHHNQPWFIAKDVTDILGVTNSSDAVGRLESDERHRFNLYPQGDVNIINESGLYSLILSSRKPDARAFKRWVTHEVLPSIRKHGVYMTDKKAQEISTDPASLAALLQQAADQLRAKDEHIIRQQSLIDAARPKVAFANAVAESANTILIGDLAKILRQNGVNMGQNRLFQWLRDNGYLMNRHGSSWNLPTQRAMDLHLFQIKETTIMSAQGKSIIAKTVKVTGRGQQYFIGKLLATATVAA